MIRQNVFERGCSEMFGWLIVGMILGSIITNVVYFLKTSYGVIIIDYPVIGEATCGLEINNMKELSKKKRVIFRVETHKQSPRK